MKTVAEIQQELDNKVNILLGQHKGRVDVVDIGSHPEVDSIRFVNVKMSGGCQGCAGAKATLKALITSCIQDFDHTIAVVVDVSDHKDKTNAFFKE